MTRLLQLIHEFIHMYSNEENMRKDGIKKAMLKYHILFRSLRL